jgi:hypothetical protein
MLDKTVTKLNFNVVINELREYYAILEKDYQHLDWSWEKCGDDIVEQWRDAAYDDPANLLTHGWAIQSNLKDITLPCPPWNISKHETVEYRNTELAFGIIEQLQEKMPYGYRWSVSVQPSGGKVSRHTDQGDECTVWIPIYTSGPAVAFEKDHELIADGSAYLLDTAQPHCTFNTSVQTRVTIIFRLKKDKVSQLLSVKGTI